METSTATVPGLDLPRLAQWLRADHPDLAPTGSLGARLIPGGMSNLTYELTGGPTPLILRRPPLGHVMATAHDMLREATVLRALAPTAVPVPLVRASRDDADGSAGVGTPFYVMHKVDGVVFKTAADNAGYGAERLHALGLGLARVLADLHSTDPEAVGLAGFGRPAGYLDRQVARWSKQLDASRSRELPALDHLGERLRASVPAGSTAAIIHGDYRLDNCLVDPETLGVAAVLDWEMATLGDPFADLALFALYWVMPSLDPAVAEVHRSSVDPAAGYPALDELVDEYAARRGIAVPALDWYLAFSAFKVAVIAESIHFRFQAGATVGDHFDRMGELTAPLAGAGLAYLEGAA